MRPDRCPCLSGDSYDECCGWFHDGKGHAPTAERLMRSRYSAFVVEDGHYLLETWHPTTSPGFIEFDAGRRWYRLDILSKFKGGPFDTMGVVEFEAFYRGGSQHEASSFVRDDGRWFYVAAT